MVRFPKEYDPFLGPYDLIISSTSIKGALKYEIFKRTVIIIGLID